MIKYATYAHKVYLYSSCFMSLLLLSLVAWMLTVLAPCVLPILPVIIGWSVVNGKKSRPRVIIASFAVSILIFTLILQWLVQQFWLRPSTLTKISAGVLIVFGLLLLFPSWWQALMHITGIDKATNKAKQSDSSWLWWDVILWAVLWPVFNTCSPTYAVLVATILPASFAWWLINILAYIVWLAAVLWLIAYGWRRIVTKLKWASDPNWVFKKVIAIILVFVGVAMLMKWDKAAEAWLLQNGVVIDTTQWEISQVQEFK